MPELPSRLARQRMIDDLLVRDGGRCVWCSQLLDGDSCSPDHVVPRARGGHAHIDNYLSACSRCNSVRGVVNIFEHGRQRAAAGSPVQDQLLEAAYRRGWESAAAGVAWLIVVETCYAEQVSTLEAFEALELAYDWKVRRMVPADLARRYLAVVASAERRYQRLEQGFERAYRPGMRRGELWQNFAAGLHQRERAATRHLWASTLGREPAEVVRARARELLFFSELRRCFSTTMMRRAEKAEDILAGVNDLVGGESVEL